MGDDLIPILTRLHREVVLPDVRRLLGDLEERVNARLDNVERHFDDVCKRFDRLETEYLTR